MLEQNKIVVESIKKAIECFKYDMRHPKQSPIAPSYAQFEIEKLEKMLMGTPHG